MEIEQEYLSFDQLKEGDHIENFEPYEQLGSHGNVISTQTDNEHYIVLYDRYNSTMDENTVIVEVFDPDDVHVTTRPLKRSDFNWKKMKAYRI